MGIHSNENNGETSGASGKQSEAFKQAGLGRPAAPEATAPIQSRRLETNIEGPQAVNTRFFRSMGRAPISQAISEAKKAFEKVMSEAQRSLANTGASYLIDSIDNTSPGVKIGALVVCAHFIDPKGRKTMLAFPLLLEGSVSSMGVRDITPRTTYDMNPADRRQVFEQMVASDYVGNQFAEALVAKLKATHGDFDVIIIGNMVVPRTVNMEKDFGIVHDILVAAMAGIDTTIQTKYRNEPPLTVLEATKGATTSIAMDHATAPTINEIGLPQRRDITLTLRSSVRSQIPGEPEETTDVVAVRGYMDLYYTEPPAPTALNQRADTRRFTPVFVINSLESVEWNLVTVETKLLALGMAPMLAANDQYKAPFMSRATQNDPIHDAGALGYLVNFSGDENGQPVGKEDMSAMSTKEQLELLRMSIFPNLYVAMAVPRSGPSSWIDTLFFHAAKGDEQAYAAICNSANALTGGVFGQKWTGGQLFEFLPGGKLFGYYTDPKTGEQRDLADLDTLWALNTFGGSSSPDNIWNFFDTFLRDGNMQIQMAERWKIISNMYSSSATLVDTGVLISPTAAFLECLTDSLVAAGLVLRAGTMLQDFSGARGHASFQGGRGLDSQAVAATMNRGFGTMDRRGRAGDFVMGLNRSFM